MDRSERLKHAFGEVLRELRLEARLSQEQLAETADLHRNYIGLVERGINAPSLTAIASLARALNSKPSDLVRMAEERLDSRV